MTYGEMQFEMQLTDESSIAVVAYSDPECTDIELLPLKPRPMPQPQLTQLLKRVHVRNLRPVAVLGLVGITPECALREPLEPEQVSALKETFLTYLSGGELRVYDSVEWYERLLALPDTRPEKFN